MLFLAPQHIQFTTHFFDFESKNCIDSGVDQAIRQRETENVLKTKAKSKAKVLQKEFLKLEIKPLCSA